MNARARLDEVLVSGNVPTGVATAVRSLATVASPWRQSKCWLLHERPGHVHVVRGEGVTRSHVRGAMPEHGVTLRAFLNGAPLPAPPLEEN